MLRVTTSVLLICFLTLSTRLDAGDAQLDLSDGSLEHARQLRDAAMAGTNAYAIVESLTTEVGPRPAGSAAEESARRWAVNKLQSLGFDDVRIEPFTITAWTRGEEEAAILSPYPQPLALTTLGGSIATPSSGITANVAFFETFADLKAVEPNSLNGQIAFVSHKMQRTQDGSAYGTFGKLRREGASVAADKGASALLIRSIGTDSHRFPHTGQMDYDAALPKIPAAAISNPDADQFERIHRRGETLEVFLNLQPTTKAEQTSGNVIADIKGHEAPDEIVIIGGHLDSWDLGTGAIDDGAGVGIATAAAQLILQHGKRPRRTLRLILWGSEEVGLLGGKAYLERHRSTLSQHIIGSESDFGAGRVWQLTSNVGAEGQPLVDTMASLMTPIGVAQGSKESKSAGPDLTPMVKAGMPALRLRQNGMDYFDLHHTADDTLDKINASDLDQNVAAFVVFAWLAADTQLSFR